MYPLGWVMCPQKSSRSSQLRVLMLHGLAKQEGAGVLLSSVPLNQIWVCSFCLCKEFKLEPMPISLIPYVATSALSTAVSRDDCVYKPDIDEKLPLVQRLAELFC